MSLVQLARFCRVASQHAAKRGDTRRMRQWAKRESVVLQAIREGYWS